MEDRKIYELLNGLEVDVDEIEEMTEMEKRRYKKNFKERNKKNKGGFKKLAVAAALVVALGGASQTSLGQDVYARTQSKLDDIGYSLTWAMNKDKAVEPYSNIVNKVVEDQGVGIKLSHVLIDRDELIISSLIDTSSLDEDITSLDLDTKVYINGKKINSLAASGSSGKLEGEEDVLYHIEELDVEGIDLEEDLDIKIVFSNHSGFGSETSLRGNWEYEFSANGRDLAEKTHLVNLDHSFSIGDEEYRLKDLGINPVNQKIYGEYKGQDKLGHKIELRGQDNLGRELKFSLTRKVGSRLVLTSEGEWDESIESLSLRPYASEYSKESGRENTDYQVVGEEFTIKLR